MTALLILLQNKYRQEQKTEKRKKVEEERTMEKMTVLLIIHNKLETP